MTKPPRFHLQTGALLAPLRDEGVLIVGSGLSWHNMRGFSPAFTAKSQAFDAWLGEAMIDPGRRDEAIRHWDQGPYAREAHPREEHLAPLFVATCSALVPVSFRITDLTFRVCNSSARAARFRGGYWVITARVKRVTTRKPTKSQPATSQRSVSIQCLNGVFAAGGGEATTGAE